MFFFFLSFPSMEKCKNRWERVVVWAPVGKAWLTLLGCPVYNSCPLFQSSAHVYSFWHQGQKADRSVFTEAPNSHNGMLTNNTIMMQRDNWTHTLETSSSNNQFAQISTLSWSVFKMVFAGLKHCWYDLWAPHPWGQVLNPLHPLRVQSHKRHMLFKSCHQCSPWHPGTQVWFS